MSITNKNNTVLYVGFTKQLEKRSKQHKAKNNKGSAKRHNVHKLVYFETTQYVNNTIKREKQIKRWNGTMERNPHQ